MAVGLLKVTLDANRQWRNDFKITKKVITFYLEFNTWPNFHFGMLLKQRYYHICEVW